MGRSQIWNFHPIQVKMYQFFIPNLGIILPVYYRRYKLASSVNLYRFTHFLDFPSGSIFVNCLLGQHPQSPLNATSGVGCAFILNTFTYWLLRNLHWSSIPHKRKMKTWEKLYLIIFVMCGNPLPDKLSGSLVGNSPTSNKSANGWIQLHPNLGWTTSCQLGTKLKIKETEKRKSLRHNLCRSWRYGLYACGQVSHKTAQVLFEN